MFTYSVLEASEKLGISTRAVQKRCKKEDVRKKDNKFLITDSILEKWEKERASNEPTNEPANGSQDGSQEIAELKKEIEGLKADIQQRKSQLDLEVESLKTATD